MTNFDDVLAIYQEFGPRRSIPVEDRWRERFPSATADDLAFWREHCKAIDAAAWTLADQVLDGRISERRAKAELGRQFRELSSDSVGRTHALAMYYASK